MNINRVIVPEIEGLLADLSGVAGIVLKDLSDGEIYNLREMKFFL